MPQTTPENNPPAAPSFGVVEIVLLLMALAPWVAVFLIRADGLLLGAVPGVYLGVVMALLAIPSAVLTASLGNAVRLVYLLHYCVLIGLLSVSLTLSFMRLAPVSNLTFAVCAGGLIGAGPWALAHVLGALASNARGALFISVVTILITLGLLHIGLFIFPIVLLLLLAVSVKLLMPQDGQPGVRQKPSTSAAGLAFLIMNVVLAVGLVPFAVPLYLHFFTLEPEPAMTLGEFIPLVGHKHGFIEPQIDFPGIALALRWGAAFVGTALGAIAVYLWPQRPATRLRVFLGLAALLGAACATGVSVPHRSFLAIVGAAIGVLAAGALASDVPRRERFPHAVIGAAIGGTILLQAQQLIYRDAVLGSGGIWLVEALCLAVLWGIAYLLGVRVIRSRSDALLSPLPDEPASSPDERTATGAPGKNHGPAYTGSSRI